MYLIQSAHNEQLKRLSKLLKQAKTRRELGLAAMEGVHVLQAYLHTGVLPEQVFVSEKRAEHAEVAALLRRLPAGVVHVVTGDALSKISALTEADDVISVIKRPVNAALPTSGNGMLLEDVQDPGNIGTIIRCAAAVGLDWLLLSKGAADVYAPKVLRAAMGGHFGLAIYTDVDAVAWAQQFTGRLWMTALGQDSDSLYDLDLKQDGVWVMGNEGNGISEPLLALAAKTVHIPMHAHTESLNVAMAATVCVFEQQRQRLQHAVKA